MSCKKSEKIIKDAAEFYANDKEFKKKYLDSRGIGGALACLYLMSTGEDKYLPVVKEYFDNFPDDPSKIGDHTWNNGYNGIACAEYYLRTGDKSVLPIIQYYCDNAKARQKFGRGWIHWGKGVNPRYVAGGLMNPAGCQILTTLLLGKECGVDVDDGTLNRSLRYWYRFAGHGTVPYGDHLGEGGLGSNGKDGMAAAAMQVAMGARSDTEIYKKARNFLSMAMVTSYPKMVTGHGDNGRGDGIWRGTSAAYMLNFDADQYHEQKDKLKWWYDLSRRPSGAVGMAAVKGFDDVGSGAAVALSYTAPLKNLRINGALHSKYAKPFTLPEKLWGNEADLAFLSVKHNPKYYNYGEKEPVHIPFYKFGGAYHRAKKLNSIPEKEMIKNVYHRRYVIRAQAAKALCKTGAFDELEKLLNDDDPRVRRAALDGMMDYRYWFLLGKNPIKPEQFSSKMVASIRKMLSDEDESVWVVHGALAALKHAPAKDIASCHTLIRPWTTHDDWWLREAAFVALSGLEKDQRLYRMALPVMLEMFKDEYHTMPRQRMQNHLTKSLQRHKSVRKMILAGMLKAAKESVVLDGQRGGEGAFNVYKAALECAKHPESAIRIGKIVLNRSSRLSSEQMSDVGEQLLNTLDKLNPKEQKMLTGIIYDYRSRLIKELKSNDLNSKLMDRLIKFSKLKNPDIGWESIGTPSFDERVWRYTTVEPKGKDVLAKTKFKRHRQITLPDELENWYKPEFDDSDWKKGKAPIGVGEFKRGNTVIKNKSKWSDGEFILMRTTFELDSVDYDKYRLRVLANKGFTVYLNGKRVQNYIWWEKKPYYKKFDLNKNVKKIFRKGTNVLAVYAGAGYDSATFEKIGQIDIYIEGFDTSELMK